MLSKCTQTPRTLADYRYNDQSPSYLAKKQRAPTLPHLQLSILYKQHAERPAHAGRLPCTKRTALPTVTAAATTSQQQVRQRPELDSPFPWKHPLASIDYFSGREKKENVLEQKNVKSYGGIAFFTLVFPPERFHFLSPL